MTKKNIFIGVAVSAGGILTLVLVGIIPVPLLCARVPNYMDNPGIGPSDDLAQSMGITLPPTPPSSSASANRIDCTNGFFSNYPSHTKYIEWHRINNIFHL